MAQAPAQGDLFPENRENPLPEGFLLRKSLLSGAIQAELIAGVQAVAAAAPFRHPRTKGNGVFSAAITNCGTVGWWSDAKGYRYTPTQPDGDTPWPAMPASFRAAVATAVAGTPWAGFTPDACLINFYGPDAKMGLHQDRDERDFSQPIVTVCLGDAADFLVGGAKRGDKTVAARVESGDVLVMGPPSRMLFHGVRKVHAGTSPIPGVTGRYSLTFRKAL